MTNWEENLPGGCGARKAGLTDDEMARVLTEQGIYVLTQNTVAQAELAIARIPEWDELLAAKREDGEVGEDFVLASQIVQIIYRAKISRREQT